MSTRLLGSWRVQSPERPIIQTAIDDLESFLWLLIWAIVHILKDKDKATTHNIGIKAMLNSYSRDAIAQRSKESDIMEYWEDAVFRPLIKKWIGIFRAARNDIQTLSEDFIRTPLGSSERDLACNRLESYCMSAYNEVLKSGFGHLKEVKKYLTWDEVVDAWYIH
jgi:hypothetical protein